MTPSTLSNLTDAEKSAILSKINDEVYQKLIPTISICASFSIIGTIGNSLSVYLFASRMKRNFQNNLFILVCSVNLMACAVCITADMADLRYMYMYPSVVACKVTRFCNMFTIVGSVLALGTLTVYRLRAATSARMTSTTSGTSLRGIAAILICSVGVAWLDTPTGPVVFGMKATPTRVPGVVGRDCSIGDDVAHTGWQLGFYIFLGAAFIALVLTVIICYYRIWRIVKVSRMAVAAHTTANTHTTLNNTVAELRDVIHTIHEHSDHEVLSLDIPGSSNEAGNSDVYKQIDPIQPAATKSIIEPLISSNHVLDFPILAPLETPMFETLEQNQSRTSGVESLPEIHAVPSFDTQERFDNTEQIYHQPSQCEASDLHVVCGESSSKETLLNGNIKAVSETARQELELPQKVSKIVEVVEVCVEHNHTLVDSNTLPVSASSQHPVNVNNNTNNLSHISLKSTFNFSQLQVQQDIETQPLHNAIISDGSKTTDAGTRQVPKELRREPSMLSRATSVRSMVKVKNQKTTLESAITRTAFLLTFTFIVSYVPFFVASMLSLLIIDFDYSENAFTLNALNMAYRLYFINPTISPFIIWASNLDFRRKLRSLCCRDGVDSNR
ncbi:uncharacterized protein LOC131936888 [Physella acuta]|uniref:uncharacterized protein LOC131936888 n=1 Tax=Physella acuta TaxID=109671 RepID=UPI0027DB33D6|nr:uncharacterized protein LOC131936888 [Physella acuta]